MLRGDLLALLGVEEFEVGLRDPAGAVLRGDLVDHRDRRFGLDAEGWINHLVLAAVVGVAAQHERFVFPREENIADPGAAKR